MHFLQRFEAVASPLPQAEPSLASEPLAIPAGDGPCPYGPSGAMDDDGYSTPHSYGEKATIERTLLAALELRAVEATEANLYDLVLATNAYADDLRQRIARFDELEHDLQRRAGLPFPSNSREIGVQSASISTRLEGADVYARVATFQSDPAHVDDAIAMVRSEVESGSTPPGLEGAKMLMLVDRANGKGVGVTLFESEEAMRRGDDALNAMNPGSTERRTSVEFYEVPVQNIL